MKQWLGATCHPCPPAETLEVDPLEYTLDSLTSSAAKQQVRGEARRPQRCRLRKKVLRLLSALVPLKSLHCQGGLLAPLNSCRLAFALTSCSGSRDKASVCTEGLGGDFAAGQTCGRCRRAQVQHAAPMGSPATPCRPPAEHGAWLHCSHFFVPFFCAKLGESLQHHSHLTGPRGLPASPGGCPFEWRPAPAVPTSSRPRLRRRAACAWRGHAGDATPSPAAGRAGLRRQRVRGCEVLGRDSGFRLCC